MIEFAATDSNPFTSCRQTLFGSMSATPCEELCDQGQGAKLETDPLMDVFDCVIILEAAGWASAADGDVPLPTQKTLITKGFAAQTLFAQEWGPEGSFVVLEVLGEVVRERSACQSTALCEGESVHGQARAHAQAVQQEQQEQEQ